MLQALAPDLDERETYTCGPAAYMASVRRILGDVGYDMSRYHEESFAFDALPGSDVPPLVKEASSSEQTLGTTTGSEPGTAASTAFSVELVRSGRTLSCRPDETILDAAFAVGLRLPASCTQGMCGTCKSTKLSGDVDMQHNGGIRPREIDQGKILVCCSRPLTDVRIDA
jgi:ferredoxin